jgi:hypothetical protein
LFILFFMVRPVSTKVIDTESNSEKHRQSQQAHSARVIKPSAVQKQQASAEKAAVGLSELEKKSAVKQLNPPSQQQAYPNQLEQSVLTTNSHTASITKKGGSEALKIVQYGAAHNRATVKVTMQKVATSQTSQQLVTI